MANSPNKFRGASVRPVGGAGKARALSPNPQGDSKKAGAQLRDLERTKLEGDPLTLSGNVVEVNGQYANPSAPTADKSAGDRLILRQTSSRKIAIGVGANEFMWFQAQPTGFDWWLIPGSPVMRLTEGGVLAGALLVGAVTADPHSTIQSAGSFAVKSSLLLASNPVDDTNCFVVADATGGAITITLPATATCAGRIYKFLRYNSGANNVVIDGSGAETINGAATKTLGSQYATITIINDGIEWYILSQLGTVT